MLTHLEVATPYGDLSGPSGRGPDAIRISGPLFADRTQLKRRGMYVSANIGTTGASSVHNVTAQSYSYHERPSGGGSGGTGSLLEDPDAAAAARIIAELVADRVQQSWNPLVRPIIEVTYTPRGNTRLAQGTINMVADQLRNAALPTFLGTRGTGPEVTFVFAVATGVSGEGDVNWLAQEVTSRIAAAGGHGRVAAQLAYDITAPAELGRIDLTRSLLDEQCPNLAAVLERLQQKVPA